LLSQYWQDLSCNFTYFVWFYRTIFRELGDAPS
jgi:hypothetical protein